jgi:5-methylcytosine-specific restriction enzyme subunit McrC
VAGLFERIASILSNRVLERARKGLHQAYVGRHEDLLSVRGRIDIRESLRRVPPTSGRLPCEFQELTPDLEDNQLLFWTLHRVARFGLQRDQVQKTVQRACRVLAGTVSLQEKLPSDCIGRWYHRLNDDYRPMHGLCHLLLDHLGPDILVGERQFLPFVLDMPMLFESFVAEWLKQAAPEPWLFKAQHRAKLKSTADLSFRIDLILRDRMTGNALAVFDTKYKLSEAPTESDVQQVVAYAVEMGVDRAFLIYPSAHSQHIKAQIGHIQVDSLICDLALGGHAAGTCLLDDILAAFPSV